MPPNDDSINYIEFPLTDTERTKSFYSTVFGWQFQDWGEDYISFSGAQVDGGFNRERNRSIEGSGALIVLFAEDLESKLNAVKSAGGTIAREIFEFPGGRRFHFVDPNGNEIAVWAE